MQISQHPSIFTGAYPDHLFVLFSVSHWMALGILGALFMILWWLRDWFSQPWIDLRTRWILASLLLLQEISLSIWRMSIGTWEVGTSLPLHLCGLGIVLGAFALINRSYLLYELVYFWGLGGAIQALLTPDIGAFGYPHYRFFQFFVSHGTLIFASLYMTWVSGLRPTHRSIWKVWGITNIYMVFIAGFNWITNGNYLFICHKPEGGSIIDVLGPWPWYVLVLEGVALVSFYIYYLPFAAKDGIRLLNQRRT